MRTLVNGQDQPWVPASDRGLLYGDGVFETIRFVQGVAPLWPRHMQRLRDGCARLGLPAPDVAALALEAQRVRAGMRDAVVRITLTRGPAARGYAPPAQARATRIVAAHPVPAIDPDWYARGIRVRFCELRLAVQPRLAGLKHLNRLQQVMARAEWQDPDVVEGLVFDQDGYLISATAANLFVVQDGVLVTPAVDRCGVAGVMRAELLAALPCSVVRAVPKEALMRIDEMFLCSSVRGVLPVREVAGRALRVGALTRTAQARWAALGFSGAGA
ncbi:MAG: aminodeoxychorismate lyase [Rhodanobacteraceae bacterium]|nr:MAG: aminodeoxychorismate lyase [Rhodanobacteraceae bacterium]